MWHFFRSGAERNYSNGSIKGYFRIRKYVTAVRIGKLLIALSSSIVYVICGLFTCMKLSWKLTRAVKRLLERLDVFVPPKLEVEQILIIFRIWIGDLGRDCARWKTQEGQKRFIPENLSRPVFSDVQKCSKAIALHLQAFSAIKIVFSMRFDRSVPKNVKIM